MTVYSNGGYCFVCGKFAKPSELSGVVFDAEPAFSEPENLAESFKYIESLPLIERRGLTFRTDAYGYYVVWPNRAYYKKRLFSDKTRYLGAKGHTPPLFWARQAVSRDIAVCEGEINALSVARALPWDVCSPGGVGEFTPKRFKRLLPTLASYDRVVVICDEDVPGARALIESLGYLWGNRINAVGIAMKPDANDLLCTAGAHEIKDRIENELKKRTRSSVAQSSDKREVSLCSV